MTIAAGTRLGPYEILAPLGAGGMGEVYLAKDTRLDRRVALKLLPSALVSDEQAKRRLLREAKSAATLDHPNICAIYEVGEASGRSFIGMQFVDGETLAARIDHKPLDIQGALHIANQVVEALAAAHSRGIVHRDIKPQNIMLTTHGQVKVLDFGLAKIVQQRSLLESEAETQSLLTERGVILGTVPYMSPEQINGDAVDGRSDIFSFGALLYEMVTGQQAFRGSSVMATLAAVLNQQPKPLPSEVPDGVAGTILRCLEKDPAHRYQTMSDVKIALEGLRERRSTVPPVRRPLRWPWIGAASLFFLLAIGLFFWQPWRAPQNMEPLRAIALTSLPGVELYPAFSVDGNNVAYSWTGVQQDNSDIYVQTIGSGARLRLTTDPRQDSNPVWSPDGRWIAFLRGEPAGPLSYGQRELLLVPPFGGAERKVAELRVQEYFNSPVYLAWSADGNALIATDSPGEGKPDALFVISLETGERRQLTDPQPPVLSDTNPAVSPDGHALVFHRRVTWSHGELYVMQLGPRLTAVGEPRRLTPLVLAGDYPTWMPDGKEILFSARGFLWRMDISGASAPVRLPFVGEDGSMPVVSRPAPGKPARLAYVRSFSDTNIYRINTSAPGAPSLSPPVVAIASTGQDLQGRFSPDGRRVAFTSTRSGEWEIWVTDPDGSNAIQLTFMHAQVTGGAHWSPDGQRIVFASDLEGQFEIYEIDASGGQPRRVTSHPAFDHVPNYSADGKWIYFCSARSGPYQIWKVPVSGGDPVQVTTTEGFTSFESTDGAYLYYTESSSRSSPMWRAPTSGGAAVKLFEGVVMWDFAVVERGIYYVDQVGGEQRLQFFDFATRASKTIARNLGETGGGVSATPDGRTILFNRKDSSIDDLMLVENFR